MTNKIKSHWELIQTELDSIESSDSEILQDQILYSLNRQLRELEAIHKRTGAMIEELQHVQNWVRGVE
jgi:hypothetical protein